MEERKQVGRIPVQKGHSLFEFNTETLIIKKVDKSELKQEFVLGDKLHKDFKLVYNCEAKKGNIYVTALNLKNAIKKVSKYYGK